MEANDLCYVDETGFHRATYEDVLGYIQDIFYTIFGNDINIDPDTQDGDLIAAAIARPLFDTILIAEATYSSFSPATATGDALTRNVRINGIERNGSTYSTVELVINGSVGAVINNGIAQDTLGQRWLLPPTVTIPLAGTITVTGTAQLAGSITTEPNTITKKATPTNGWLSVNNPAAPTMGRPVESDAELRAQQQISVALPARSLAESILGNVANVDGVDRVMFYENDTDEPDDNGIPAYNISVVVEGGLDDDIANAIATTKAPGIPTYGTTSIVVLDSQDMPNTINFFRPTIAVIGVEITLEAKTNYNNTTEDLIKAAVVEYINGLLIGEDVIQSKLYIPCYLDNAPVSKTYEVDLIEINRDGGSFSTADIDIAFNEAAQTTVEDISILYV